MKSSMVVYDIKLYIMLKKNTFLIFINVHYTIFSFFNLKKIYYENMPVTSINSSFFLC